MCKRTKRLLIILSAGILAAIGVAVVLVKTAPPLATDPNSSTDSYAAEGKILIDDSQKESLLGYLDGFNEDSLTGEESAVDAKRITQMNAMIQEYRSTVDSMYGQVMLIEDYEAQEDILMDMYGKLLRLEPHQTPEEDLHMDIVRGISMLTENLKHIRLKNPDNVEPIERCIDDLTGLCNRLQSGGLSLETAKQEYRMLLEGVRAIVPYAYEQHFRDRVSIESLMRIERGDLPRSVYGTLGIPHRYSEKSKVTDAFYSAVYYDVTDTVEAVIAYGTNTAEKIFAYETGVDEIYLHNTKTGEKVSISDISARLINDSDDDKSNDITEYYFTDPETGADITIEQWLNR